jgi:hypothetical protein
MMMEDDMPMLVEEDVGIIRKMMVCRSPRIDKLLFSIIIRVCFVYGFCLVWNLNPSCTWL